MLSFGGDEEGDEDMLVLKKMKFDIWIVMEDEIEKVVLLKLKLNKVKGKERKLLMMSLFMRELFV